MYEFLLTVHVLCAVIWVGGAVMMHIFGRLATKDGPEQQLAFTQHSIRLGNIIIAPLAVILFGSFAMKNVTPRTAGIMYWTIVSLIGASLGVLVLRYTGASIASTLLPRASRATSKPRRPGIVSGCQYSVSW